MAGLFLCTADLKKFQKSTGIKTDEMRTTESRSQKTTITCPHVNS